MGLATAPVALAVQQDTTAVGAWYTHPAWTALGIVTLVLLIVLISRVGRREPPNSGSG